MKFRRPKRSSPYSQTLQVVFLLILPLCLFSFTSHSYADSESLEKAPQVITESVSSATQEATTAQVDKLDSNLLQDSETRRVQWLEIFFEIFQKYAVLVFLAFLLILTPLYRKQLVADRIHGVGRVFIGVATILLSLLFGMLDFAKYGESAWAFLDYQVILTVIGGLLGGFPIGCIVGGVLGMVRLWLEPQHWFYATSVFSAGVIAGMASSQMKSFRRNLNITFGTGFVVGLIHGALFYLPLSKWMSSGKLILSIGFLGFVEAVAVALFFFILAEILRNDDQRETEKQLLKTRLLFLQAQMSPHFLFNALNAISALCGEENAEKSRSLVIKLSDFLRQTLRREESRVTLKEEFTYIDAYLEIEQARFGDKLKVERCIEIEESTWNRKIPILTLQPLVENAIKHGITKNEGGGVVRIKVTQNKSSFTVTVSDDGPGMNPEYADSLLMGVEPRTEASGIGIRNICERLKRHFGTDAKIRFETQVGTGCMVHVDFPLNNRTL